MASIPDLLRGRYPAKTHALLFEVRNDAGFNANRSCDALAMGLWPSRGLKLSGFEFKVSRADWLKEYREPEKAESFSVYCDEWWIVAGDSKIVQMDELPEAWGLLVAKGQRLECVKEAPKNPKPEPIDRGLLAAMMKRAYDQFTAPGKAEYQRGVVDGRKAVQDAADNSAKYDREQHLKLSQRLQEFERASGISIQFDTTDGAKLGRAVRLVLDGAHQQLQWPLQQLKRDAEQLVTAIANLEAASRIEAPKVREPAA